MAKNYIDNLSEEVRKCLIEKTTHTGNLPFHCPHMVMAMYEKMEKHNQDRPTSCPFIKNRLFG
jgi:hypothetical protein